MGRYDHAAYVSLTMEFRCNLKCVHCMIEGTMDRLAPESDAHFEAVLAQNARERRWTGLILTGSEITLRRDLPDLARRARASGFEHVRIQTHGMHLGQPSFCRRLVEAGVDEFFVSIAGSDAESHDGLTLVPGSFERALRGLETLDAMEGIATLTNTVVTARSYRLLPGIVERLAHLKRLTQMEFWVYFPMAERDEKDLVASHAVLLPYLREAVLRARALGRAVEIKNFPECLLGDLGDALVNGQPELHIDPDFWREFERNGFYQCVHRDACASRECLGLNTAYIAKFGTEANLLQPLRGRRRAAI
ncbi:radical SAM protein [Methylobacterium durans]|uniref:radical SAM protein n=1 Tax=Methylobacterium durans TaxID=2202825 RepID=UPI002AFE1400|nr:radical SAM protein [Methylobacterium durans]MEA1831387.1 radical SAM protein [Methylobacterium durans]